MRIVNCALALVLLLPLVPCQAADAPRATIDIVLDGAGPGRVFDGIGATSGGGASSRLLVNYPEPQRSQILDYLFKPNYGASLQLLKVEVGSDGNAGMGSEPSHMRAPGKADYTRGYEWWLMREAKRRNPAIKLLALAWNFPAWIGQPNSQAGVDYLVAFVAGARQAYNIDIDYLGLWNETRIDPRFIVMLRHTLDAQHLATKIIADDLVNTWAITDAMQTDPQLLQAVDVIATHYPRTQSPATVQDLSAQWHKPLWSSEDGPWGDAWGTFGPQSTPLAELLNRNYIQARITSTNLWNLVTSYYDILDYTNAGLLRANTPWSGHYQLTSPLWVVAHTTQFVKPGWQYLDGASALLPGGGSYVSLHDGAQYSTVIETIAARAPVTLRFTLQGGLATGTVHVWRSTATDFFRELAPIHPVEGKFTIELQPHALYSLTTTTGQARGDAAPPPARAFPLPYKEDFESYRLGEDKTRFFSEQNGVFEVADCGAARAGQCLRQSDEQPPIWWTYGPDAPRLGTTSVMGDARWRDYRVSADVLLESPGYVSVFGRVTRVLCCDGTLSGYQLRLYDSGKWELLAESKDGVLASGAVAPRAGEWRHEELSFRGDHIRGAIDGATVVDLVDQRHPAGLAGLGNGWNTGRYDNFVIEPVAAGVPVISRPPRHLGPLEPPRFFVPGVANQALTLHWEPVAGASGYRIRIGTHEGEFLKALEVGNVTSYKVTTLTNGLKYYFQVIAVRDGRESKPSEAQSATPSEQEP